jgi:hypothetical protein
VLPPFGPQTGRLPEGEHPVSWEELVDRFGWTPRRRRLLDGLAEAVELLAAAGCTRLWLNGSFVTAKDDPADFDACWDPDGVDLDALDRSFSTSPPVGRNRRKGSAGNCSPTWWRPAAAWTSPSSSANERDGGRKGIVVLTLGGEP